MAERRKKKSIQKRKNIIPPAIWLNPVFNTTTKEYEWPDFEIKKNKLGIEGVFARHDLSPNTRFIYYGDRISSKQYNKLVKEHQESKDKSRISYIADCPGKLTCLVDAFPGISPSKSGVGGNGKFIGGKVNEPAPGQRENAWFYGFKDKDDGKMWPGILIVSKVKKGHELVIHYGPDYDRYYLVGLPRKTEPHWFQSLE